MIITRENYKALKRYTRGYEFTFEEGKNLPVEERERLENLLLNVYYSRRLEELGGKLEEFQIGTRVKT